MDNPKNIDPQASDKMEAGDDEIIDLTEVVEVKPQKSLEKDISPDDFLDDEGFVLSDDADMAEPDSEELPEPAILNETEEPVASADEAPPEVQSPAVDEIPDPAADVSDLGALVSEITGAASEPEAIKDHLPGFENIPAAQLDMAVERAVEKIFKEKIEAKVMALFEAVVKREIDKITELIKEKANEE